MKHSDPLFSKKLYKLTDFSRTFHQLRWEIESSHNFLRVTFHSDIEFFSPTEGIVCVIRIHQWSKSDIVNTIRGHITFPSDSDVPEILLTQSKKKHTLSGSAKTNKEFRTFVLNFLLKNLITQKNND